MADSDTPPLDASIFTQQDIEFAVITTIVKRRYQTGEYASTHFRMTTAYWEAARIPPMPTPPRMPWDPAPLDALLGIPVVVDDDLTGDEWRLVDTHTDEILFRGGTR